jgi:hypothetical protein
MTVKKRQSRRQTAKVSHSRWLAYATASVATALAGSHSAEAATHYSGILNERIDQDTAKTFPLDQAGDFIWFERLQTGGFGATNVAYFRVYGIASAKFRGFLNYTYYLFVSKLRFGELIPATTFGWVCCPHPPELSGGFLDRFGYQSFPWAGSQWKDRGPGYIGFRFNNGAGIQYGWARVWITGHPENAFKVIDYAYGDVGDRIRAGQKGGNEMVPEESNDIVPDEGSLGGLALGAVGLLAWRKSRSRAARLEST